MRFFFSFFSHAPPRCTKHKQQSQHTNNNNNHTKKGLAQGESRTLRIDPEDAYGPILAQAVITLPREKGQPEVQEGARVMLSNGLPAKVVIVSDEGELLFF